MASLRRSSVKLSSLGKSNGELKLIISQLKTVRENYVNYTKSQEKAVDDMTKWALKEDNRAIQDAVERFNDLFVLWSETQREFAETMDDFRQQFKMILEGEQIVESAKSDYEAVEHREHKIIKELKKLSKKVGNHPNPPPDRTHELRDLEHKLNQVSQDKALFKREANDRIKEQEATKMIRFKNAFQKFTIGHLDMADKCDICFSAGRDIVNLLPDVENTDIHKVRYTGSGNALKATIKAKELIKSFRSRSAMSTRNDNEPPAHQLPSSPPPHQPNSGNGAAAGIVGATASSNQRRSNIGARTTEKTDDELPPPYSEVQPPRNPYYRQTNPPQDQNMTPNRPHNASLNDSTASSNNYMLNYSSQSYPASPAYFSDTTTAPSSADSSFR